MAAIVSVTSASILYPVGEIRPEWFSGEDLDASLSVWLNEGAAKVPTGAPSETADAIASAWCYYRAYRAKAAAMAASPDTVSIPDAPGRTLSTSRVNFFRDRAAEWLSAFEAALASVTVVVQPAAAPAPRSRSVPISFSW